MGIGSKIKFILRSIILGMFLVLFIQDKNGIIFILNSPIIHNIKLYHIIWLLLFLETLFVAIPYTNNHSYNGKMFAKHFYMDENYNKIKLKEFTEHNNKIALYIFICWVSFNIISLVLFKIYNLHITYVLLVFVFYYWADMFCVNIWCPVNKIFFRNKCCNECRIYNWDHIMYFTPLFVIKSVWSYSLLCLSLLLVIQWEYMLYKHPERFSPISNKNLQCKYCKNSFRFRKNKKSQKKR